MGRKSSFKRPEYVWLKDRRRSFTEGSDVTVTDLKGNYIRTDPTTSTKVYYKKKKNKIKIASYMSPFK